jgi:probable F420-dependent oxidoreductase
MAMKVGVNLLNFGPGATPASLARWSRLAEDLGYHLVMISDHVAITPDVAVVYPAPFYDPFVALAWLAAQTTRIELGTTVVILPYRHPLLVARMAANLDQLSGGRFILGVGVGWAEQEFAALGVPFAQRGALSDDSLTAIQTAWTSELASYQGSFIAFESVQTGPRPARTPSIPIWVGGNGRVARRRAVRFGAAWHPLGIRMGWLLDTALPDLRTVADAAGMPVPPLCPRIRLRLTDRPLAEEERLVGEGSREQVHADLATLQELGATYVLLDTYVRDPEETRHAEPAWEMLATLAAQVLDLAHHRVRSAAP